MAGNGICSVPCTVSRYTIACTICSKDIVPGDRMFCSAVKQPSTAGANRAIPTAPITKANKNAKTVLAWGHELCHDQNLPPPPPCRHWKRLGRCPSREMGMCAFQHDEEEKGTALTLDKQRWGGKRHFVRNQHKNSVFRIFLMQTYGMDYINKNNGTIVDVAGGKGELSFELINLSGATESVVVDPRPLNLSLVQTKWNKGLFEPKRTGVFSKWYPACEDGCKEREPRTPKHLRCFFDSQAFLKFVLADESEEIEHTNTHFEREMMRARNIVWTAKGLQHEDGASYNDVDADTVTETDLISNGIGNNNDDTTTQSETVDPKEARDILSKCHLMVGFHPDQAAGEIVEFAIARNIPW
eukprot:CAMPEP_0183711788 /NCGR_PEP_ID=MMETSP0737-20130205/7185_1 /TAXON_ID=385413 /ORGANISM="Thalassiosira miniscula, Strain CCMP1093" /LENGTH=355 /DNA_ID=CAMNT_0025940355 /DNA_START=248 /DNA_END=1312 /DNA_ORIENTATION=+